MGNSLVGYKHTDQGGAYALAGTETNGSTRAVCC
jgi:hypothetical protein